MASPVNPNRRLLLVEDDEPTQQLLRALMNCIGFDIVCASDGVEGLQALRRGGFDVVLLDLLLPRVDGFEVLREVKSLWPELVPRMIVMTAACNPATRECAELEEVWRVMRKPLDIEELAEEIFACSCAAMVSAGRKSPRRSLEAAASLQDVRKAG